MDAEALAELVRTLPSWEKSDPETSAILVLPGEHQEFRIPEALKFWPVFAKHLWVAGTCSNPFYARRDVLRIIRGRKGLVPFDDTYVETAGWAEHTPGQMSWAVALLRHNSSVNHIIVVTAAYHVSRAVLTLIKAMEKAGLECAISLIPIFHEDGPAPGSKEWEEEIAKIPVYQAKGDVASEEEFGRYVLRRESL